MSSKANYSKKILKTLAKKPVLSVDTFKDNIDKKTSYALSRSVKNLKDAGLVEIHKSENKDYLRLTQKGKNKLNCIRLEGDETLVSTSWDGFWRIVILDIPEERKSEREALRYLLKKAGFICMKNSVWISMFPYENLFNNIKKDLNLQKELMIIVSDRIDQETEKEFFSLCSKI